VRAAGVRRFGGVVDVLELPGPRRLRPDEVLIDVRVCGVGNWDEFARTGSWDLGTRPPMALGVEAAGLAAAVGGQVAGITTGDRVTVHSAPLREQGTWAEQHIAAAEHVAVLPPGVLFEAAAALPVPALTADQVIGDALQIRAGQTVLVHGAGGVTGGMLVQLAVHRGATVIATAGADSAARVAAMGASTVVDYHEPDWPERVRVLAGGGADAAANAARAGSVEAVRAVRDGGRLATITADLPAAEGHCDAGGGGRPGRQTARQPRPAPHSGLAHGFGRRHVSARAGRRRTGARQARCPRLSHRAADRRRRVTIMCPPLNTSH
jgi:NADPH:quinone reductase-like Zn-dependent oxidoreductase